MPEEKEFKMLSGAVLHVDTAPWKEVKPLHDEVLKALRGTGVGQMDLVQMARSYNVQSPDGLNVIADKVLSIASSAEITSALFKCAEHAGYMPMGPGTAVLKVNESLLDDPKWRNSARLDYYGVMVKIMAVNLRPFFEALVSVLKLAEPITTPPPQSK